MYGLRLISSSITCLLVVFVWSLAVPSGLLAGDDWQRFLNVTRWKGSFEVLVHREGSYVRKGEMAVKEEWQWRETHQGTFLTGTGEIGSADPFLAGDEEALESESGTGEAGDFLKGQDPAGLEKMMRSAGLGEKEIQEGLKGFERAKRLHVSGTKYKTWSLVPSVKSGDVSNISEQMAKYGAKASEIVEAASVLSRPVTGKRAGRSSMYGSLNARSHGEAQVFHDSACMETMDSNSHGNYSDESIELLLAVNLQKKTYSFKWDMGYFPKLDVTVREGKVNPCGLKTEKESHVELKPWDTVAFIEDESGENIRNVKFEPLPASGLTLKGRETIARPLLRDGREVGRETVTFSWVFVPGCKGEVDILYKGKSIKGKVTEVMAGEKVSLRGESDCGEGREYEWTVPGKLVENYIASEERGLVGELEDQALKKKEISFYWWDRGEHEVKVKMLTDGETRTATARFIVKKPNIKLVVKAPPGKTLVTDECEYSDVDKEGNSTVEYGYQYMGGKRYCSGFEYTLLTYKVPEGNTITFTRSQLPPGFEGETNFVQMLLESSGRRLRGAPAVDTITCKEIHEGERLDTSYPYNDEPNALVVTDNPFVKIRPDEDHLMEVSHKFRMYLMYRPSKPDAIFIPIKAASWDWEVSAIRTTGRERKGTVSDFALSGKRTVHAVETPREFPQWTSSERSGGDTWKPMEADACRAGKKDYDRQAVRP